MRPNDCDVGVIVFGPGVGESILVHLGQRKWIVVDSCIDPSTNRAAVLSYFDEFGKEDDQVVLIAGTHCDTDHTKGLADIAGAFPQAKIVLPAAFSERSFRELAQASGANPSLDEFKHLGDLAQVAHATGRTVARASQGKDLFYDPNLGVEVLALAPSDADVEKFLTWASTQLAEIKTAPRRILPPKPNDSSIAIWIKVQDETILLGGDVESPVDQTRGWRAVVDYWGHRANIKARIIKVAHHGSPNAHLDEAWDNLVDPAAIACVAPYRRGTTPRPQDADLDRVSSKSGRVYLCAPAKAGRISDAYGRAVSSAIDQSGVVVRRLAHKSCGRISVHWSHGSPLGGENVYLDGPARQVRSV